MALFGTDGVRGIANVDLTAELAVDLAIAAAHVLGEIGAFAGHRPKAIVGQDSRASGDFLESAIVAGLTSAGVDVYRVGVLPTPAIAYLVKESNADLGVMISASHNPMPDNGIKFFAKGGDKLADIVEAQIESRLGEPWDRPVGLNVGRIVQDESAKERYIKYLLSTITENLNGLKVVVDCANGAASYVAPDVYEKAGAKVTAISAAPTGWNINENCGSTHLDDLIAQVKATGADIGIAHDGDADRCILIAANGEVIDGDYILNILANDWLSLGKLAKNTVVGTVMSNLGFIKSMESIGVGIEKTAVGDRYVLECMLENSYNLGGEQSGHVIMRDFSNTGDGLLTALQVMQIMVKTHKTLINLSSNMQKYPQVLINVKDVEKDKLTANQVIQEAIINAEKELAGIGRVLIRASGTESLVRVMVEANELQTAQEIAESLAQLVRLELK
ncbi:MAG: phosphoglucosamine mutase [Actinobacteria bacterium BACL4 MAG-121022-bin9]|jgi:phosphoglucosamine mutase|nr:MAG: phosphoglucosamine mutase [Actinobacteria bacterium BACL4 MAG-121022-bin9]KRO92899.1 MAG: phosphoglucosamine mutase [Actinobacteria bacterium BACL4 MAG-120507-bin0]HCP72290.1 phosphoglucosamine mutase [Actinomycetota bacterium]